MRSILACGLLAAFFSSLGSGITAQELRVATVDRPPFSMELNGDPSGFSLDLWQALMTDLDREFEVVRVEGFSDMLGLVERGEVDAAIANISITASREEIMDFTQPIFEAGLQIMLPADSVESISVWRALLSRDLAIALLLAFALLLGGGMLMWHFEKNTQPYFDKPAKDAMFPAFWWALNLVVNGGFEERVPRSPLGRILGVFLVISSLFIVSVFVAKITSVMTVNAIQSNVNSVNDLYGKRVGTTVGSTSATFLNNRDMRHQDFENLETLLASFENRELDAVVFDAPVLAYYVMTQGKGFGRLVGPVFLRENYGIALPSGSQQSEALNQSLLRLRENGTYDEIYRKWFGALPSQR